MPKVRAFAKHYTDAEIAQAINGALREGRELSGKIDSIARAVDSALAHVRPADGERRLFRALRGVQLDDYPAGRLLARQRGYTSTSLSQDVVWEYARGGGDVWEIDVTPGARLLDVNRVIGSHERHEDEVLLPRGARFKVLAVRDRPDGLPGRLVAMELRPQRNFTAVEV